MWIYWFVCFISILGSIFPRHVKLRVQEHYINNQTISKILTAFPLLLISTIRYGVGSDYFQYAKLYNIIGSTSTSRYEWLFTAINRFLYRIGIPFHGFIILTSILFVILIVLAIHRNSPNVALSIFLLFEYIY